MDDPQLVTPTAMQQAWFSAGLKGNPSVHGMTDALNRLPADQKPPSGVAIAFTIAFKRLIDVWELNRKVICKPVPDKFVEHLPFLVDIVAGKDPEKTWPKPAPARGSQPPEQPQGRLPTVAELQAKWAREAAE
jgi:hypothetical protein